jgi:hypothetical protein
VIAVATMLYAAVWPLALVLPRNSEGEPQAAIRLLVMTTFAYLMISILAGLKLLESRQDNRSSARPPRRPLPARAVGIEVRGSARFVEVGVSETAVRLASRYIGPGEAAAYVEPLRGADVIVRIEPGDIRARDFADEYGTG